MGTVGHHSQTLWIEEAGGAIGGKCGGGAGGVRGSSKNRSQYIYAEGCAVCELCGSKNVWRECGAGGWIDFGLRKNGSRTKRKRRMVRYFNIEGAVSDRRKKDHGIRAGRTAWMEISGSSFLSHGRWSGIDRNVESVCGIGRAGMGRA